MIDMYFTESGDFFLDEDTGDLLDTKLINYRALIQKITTIVKSHKGEWNLEQYLGANVDDFKGKPNNAETGNLIKTRVFNELASVVNLEDLNVLVFPTSRHSVAIVVQVQPTGTLKVVQLVFTYHLSDNRITIRNIS